MNRLNMINENDGSTIIANMTYEEASNLAMEYAKHAVGNVENASSMQMMSIYVDTLQQYLKTIKSFRENVAEPENTNEQSLPSHVL